MPYGIKNAESVDRPQYFSYNKFTLNNKVTKLKVKGKLLNINAEIDLKYRKYEFLNPEANSH